MSVFMRLHMRIHGRVQGVGYRYFVTQSARKFGLSGWVKNLPTGDVEAEAQGPKLELDKFLETLKNGHPWARVERIQTDPASDRPDEEGFEIHG